jgi:predicted Abi (CAAX) family protease
LERGASFEFHRRSINNISSFEEQSSHPNPQSPLTSTSSSSSRIGYIVRHFDKKTRQFEAEEEIVFFEKPMLPNYAAASLLDIESSPCGTMGWFIFGERITSPASSLSSASCSGYSINYNNSNTTPCRLVRALEPRLATSLETGPTKGTVRGMHWREQQEYFEEKTWSKVREEKGMCTTLDFENELWMDGFWRLGEQFLVVSDYGSSNGGAGGHNNPFLPGIGKYTE